MPASTVSDYLFSAEPRWAGKIGSGAVAAADTTTIPLSSAANLNNGEAYVFTINRVTSDGTKNTLAQMETVIGELSGTNFINCTRGVEGTASAWAADIVVEILFTATHWSKLVTWAEVAHNQDGTHKSGLALTSPVITTPQINDTTADHQYILGVSELTADRTVTLPLLTGNDDFVFEDHAQTLTNKTFTSPVINTGLSGTAKATGAEITTGTEDAKFVTPKAIADADVNTRLKSKVITATRDLTAASGNVAYTGVGFTPTSIIAVAGIDGTTVSSVGFSDSSKGASNLSAIFGGQYYSPVHSSTLIDLAVTAGSNDQYATVATYDADGFTLTWTKANSPTGTAKISFICFR